jgi:hypothetical protein
MAQSLQSNWCASVQASVWGSADEEPDELEERPTLRRRRALPLIGLPEAATLLGIPTKGNAWRRRTLRRLRSIERQAGARFLIAAKGRGGARVHLDGLRQAAPGLFMGVDTIEELSAKVRDLEERVARAEAQLRASRPKADSHGRGQGGW